MQGQIHTGVRDLEKSVKGEKFQLKWKETQPIPSKGRKLFDENDRENPLFTFSTTSCKKETMGEEITVQI